MKKYVVAFLALGAAFCMGFGLRSATLSSTNKPVMKKVTGIGGVFFKAKDPKKAMEWYEKHLGLPVNPYGAMFEWYENAEKTRKGMTQWTPFPENTKYFGNSQQPYMINYRVENLEALIEELKKEGITIVDKMETYDYGKFVHILDSEGNQVELWEPVYP